MTTAIYNAENLPEYLLADSILTNPDQLYLVRCHAPRFIAPIDEHGDHSTITDIEWIDPPPDDVMASARLMREAGDFVSGEFEAQELEGE